MATAAVIQRPSASKKTEEAFLDKHFANVAFTISTLVLLIFSPLSLILGTIVGFAIHSSVQPNLKLKATDKAIIVPNTVFSIIGATGAILSLTPAGMLGGFVFQAIPFISSFAVGSTLYRATRS